MGLWENTVKEAAEMVNNMINAKSQE